LELPDWWRRGKRGGRGPDEPGFVREKFVLAGGTLHPLKLRLLRHLNRLSAARTIKPNLVHGDFSFDSSAASRWVKSFLLVNLGQRFVNQIQRVVEIGAAPICTYRPAPGVLRL
jgi:hypothetical protein